MRASKAGDCAAMAAEWTETRVFSGPTTKVNWVDLMILAKQTWNEQVSLSETNNLLLELDYHLHSEP